MDWAEFNGDSELAGIIRRHSSRLVTGGPSLAGAGPRERSVPGAATPVSAVGPGVGSPSRASGARWVTQGAPRPSPLPPAPPTPLRRRDVVGRLPSNSRPPPPPPSGGRPAVGIVHPSPGPYMLAPSPIPYVGRSATALASRVAALRLPPPPPEAAPLPRHGVPFPPSSDPSDPRVHEVESLSLESLPLVIGEAAGEGRAAGEAGDAVTMEGLPLDGTLFDIDSVGPLVFPAHHTPPPPAWVACIVFQRQGSPLWALPGSLPHQFARTSTSGASAIMTWLLPWTVWLPRT